MLPIIFVTFAAFLLELCTTSPVYNMQPAFITANIGTAGRNIRNLPCISRKTNQSGVCMFAIDCLKANGTHLGTCIDRFYFGSCCHIQPVHDIIENTIDTDIIPAREPPLRLSSTIKPISTSIKTTTTTKVTTQTTKTPKPEKTTNSNYKITTFQSVDGSIPVETTTKATTTTTTTTTTLKTKPITNKTTPKPKPTKQTIKLTPKPTKNSLKPIRTTTKVTSKPDTKPSSTTKKSTTTQRPTTTTTRAPTRKPPSPSTTRRPATTSVKKPSTTTTRKPSTTTSRQTTVTRKPTISSSRKPSPSTVETPVSSLKPTKVTKEPTKTTISTPTTTTTSTTSKPTTEANKNLTQTTETSKIETAIFSSIAPETTTTGSIITWTIADNDKNVSAPTTVSHSNSTSEDWVPITTSDKWVPLPSVQPASGSSTLTSSTGAASTTESASKPSITYIPLASTTASSATLNASTLATEEVATSQLTPATAAPATTVDQNNEVQPVNMSDFTNVCGRRMYPEARIVGGEKASFGKWPWQISLRQWRTSTYLHKCGAALLNENWAITAAHCVDNVPPSDLLLRLGEHDLSTESEPYLHQERRVQIVASHPQFDSRTFEYDLALLRFYEPVTFQPNILPVCVPQTDENFVGRTAYVTGWGRLYEDGPLPSVLQEVSVPVINNSVCESMYRAAGYIEHIPHIFICAGWRRGGFDSCEGDSGGPMVIQREDKRFLLAGVISWGIGCAEPNQPGVYTRISEFRDWINQILQF